MLEHIAYEWEQLLQTLLQIIEPSGGKVRLDLVTIIGGLCIHCGFMRRPEDNLLVSIDIAKYLYFSNQE